MGKIISVWSGPRNVSTALMYSFAQRSDTYVIDEPLYGHYLKITQADHPGKEEVLNAMDQNGDSVLTNIIKESEKRKVTFLKNMAHHFVALDNNYLNKFTNVFLVRDPREMLLSLSKQIPEPTLRDTGYEKLVELADLSTAPPIIIDSARLLLDPKSQLKKLCGKIDLSFDPNMLRWSAGGRPEDGIWAKYWYHNVHQSTGFKKYQPTGKPFPKGLIPLCNRCQPLYQYLLDKAL